MMIKGIIFDLDQTLIDTSKLEKYRDNRQWDYVYKNLDQTSVYPGVYQLLKVLNDLGTIICVVTSAKKEYAKKLIKLHNLMIHYLVAYNDTRYHKPSPNPMYKALQLMDLGASEVINIGDRESDMISGKSAGIYSVAFNFNSVYADDNINDMLELVDIINAF